MRMQRKTITALIAKYNNNLVNSAGFGDRKDFIDMEIDKQIANLDNYKGELENFDKRQRH